MLSRANTDSVQTQNKIARSRVSSAARQTLFTATAAFTPVKSNATPKLNS